MALADIPCYIAIYFPQDSPPGWSWGKPLSETKGAGKEHFWLNFTPEGKDYDRDDDIKVKPSALTFDNYAKSWALVSKLTPQDEAIVDEAPMPPAAV